MEVDKELLKKDLGLILKLNDKLQYSNINSVKKIYDYIIQHNNLQTPLGKRYITNLEMIINGEIVDKCILCKKDNTGKPLICSSCLKKFYSIENKSSSSEENNMNRSEHVSEKEKEGKQPEVTTEEKNLRHVEDNKKGNKPSNTKRKKTKLITCIMIAFATLTILSSILGNTNNTKNAYEANDTNQPISTQRNTPLNDKTDSIDSFLDSYREKIAESINTQETDVNICLSDSPSSPSKQTYSIYIQNENVGAFQVVKNENNISALYLFSKALTEKEYPYLLGQALSVCLLQTLYSDISFTDAQKLYYEMRDETSQHQQANIGTVNFSICEGEADEVLGDGVYLLVSGENDILSESEFSGSNTSAQNIDNNTSEETNTSFNQDAYNCVCDIYPESEFDITYEKEMNYIQAMFEVGVGDYCGDSWTSESCTTSVFLVQSKTQKQFYATLWVDAQGRVIGSGPLVSGEGDISASYGTYRIR